MIVALPRLTLGCQYVETPRPTLARCACNKRLLQLATHDPFLIPRCVLNRHCWQGSKHGHKLCERVPFPVVENSVDLGTDAKE